MKKSYYLWLQQFTTDTCSKLSEHEETITYAAFVFGWKSSAGLNPDDSFDVEIKSKREGVITYSAFLAGWAMRSRR